MPTIIYSFLLPFAMWPFLLASGTIYAGATVVFMLGTFVLHVILSTKNNKRLEYIAPAIYFSFIKIVTVLVFFGIQDRRTPMIYLIVTAIVFAVLGNIYTGILLIIGRSFRGVHWIDALLKVVVILSVLALVLLFILWRSYILVDRMFGHIIEGF